MRLVEDRGAKVKKCFSQVTYFVYGRKENPSLRITGFTWSDSVLMGCFKGPQCLQVSGGGRTGAIKLHPQPHNVFTNVSSAPMVSLETF